MDERSQGGEWMDIEGLRLGRASAIEAWFLAYCDPVYAFISRRVGRNRAVAGDVAQETFLTALETIRRFDPSRGDMLPWLTYIARNVIRKA